MTPRRGLVLVSLVILIVGAWVVDSRVDRPSSEVVAEVQVPTGAPARARSSAWFCAGATANPEGVANGTVVIANSGDRPLNGTATVTPLDGEVKQTSISVPALGRASVRLADHVNSPFASALVELDGGQAVVELAASGSLGDSVTSCASSASTTWYFAEGVTTRDAREVVTLFNPFPEDAVVDLVFTTEEGEVTPQALTGLTVQGRRMVALDLGDHVQRREFVATTISARTGRLVAGRLQTFDGSVGRKGMSVGLGAAGPGEVWYFPEGFLAEGITERFQFYNPTSAEATLDVELALEQGQAEPIQLSVPAESRVTLSADEEARIPKGVGHAVTVRSTNGVGVVVERTVHAASPSARSGLAITLGARIAAQQWVSAAGDVDDMGEVWLTLNNPGPRTARLTVTLLDGRRIELTSLREIELAPGQRRAVRVNEAVRPGPAPLLITASEPIVVERDVYRLKSMGLAMSVAIPLRP